MREKDSLVNFTFQFQKKMHFMYSFYVLSILVLLNDDLLIRLKNVSVLSTYILSCIEHYYIIINLKHNRTSNLRIVGFQMDVV